MSNDIQSALERARMVAAKITGQIPEASSAKRPADSSNSPDDGSSKKFASINDAVGAQLAMLKAQQFTGSASEEYKVPDKLVGLVIGRGGEQLHRLQADTQCKVQIAPDSNGSSERTFTLVGTKEAIERAKRSIDEILKRGSSLGSDPSNTGTSVVLQRNNCEIIEIKIPGNKCGLVIGKGGETIKRLSEQYGVKLVVVQETSAAVSGDKPLRITGEPEKVAKAKEAVLEMLNPNNGPGGGGRYQTNEYGSKPNHYGGGGDRGAGSGNEVFIKVPGDKAGIVIGKGGESIKEINRRSGAHVEIDKSQRGANATEGADKMFIIRGTSDQISYAQQLIYEKISGVQGSQPPSGFFGPGTDMSPGQSYGGSSRNDSSSAYQQQQQQWNMAAYQQSWQQPQVDPKTGQAADPNMSAAWAAYYQQYYGQATQPAAGATTNGTTTAAAAATPGSAAAVQATINPSTGQADYSQAWVEYYRSLGMHDQAEAILAQSRTGQTNGSSSTSSSSSTPSAQSSTSAQGQQPSTATSTQQNGSAQQQQQQQQYAANQAWAGYSGYGGYGN